MTLDSKVTKVTGSDSGIGHAIPLEPARLVAFLTSDRALYGTATTDATDGGMTYASVGLRA